MLVEQLQQIVNDINTANGNTLFKFNYGRGHWQNLLDLPDDSMNLFATRNKYVLLLWQDRDTRLNEYNAIISQEFTGKMYFVVRSQIMEEDYNFKYATHIKNLYDESHNMLNGFSQCDGLTVSRWKETEIENTYDTNLDGLSIEFTVKFDLDV